MTLLPLVILVAGVGTASIVLDRRLRAKKRLEMVGEDGETAPTTESNDLAQLWAGPMSWYRSLVNKQPEDFPQRFREWVVNASDAPAVKDWLSALSDEGLKAYTKHLSRFCADMGFELAWLVEGQIDQRDAHLGQTTKSIVLHYCQACQQAATCQEDLEVHKQLLSLEQHPAGRKNRIFGEQLLAKLVEANLVTTSTTAFISASTSERQQIIAAAINEAVSKDQATFNRLVREVLYHVPDAASPTGASPTAGGTAANATSGAEPPGSA